MIKAISLLARTPVFDIFGIAKNSTPYTLKTCSAVSKVTGKRAKKKKIILESADGDSSMPMLVNVNGSLTMESQSSKLHAAILTLRILLQRFQDLTPRQMPCCLLLRSTRCSISGTDVWNRCVPFTQRLSLGWVIVGNICHGGPNKCS